MLVTVVTVFIICELPDQCLRLVYAAVSLTSDPRLTSDPGDDLLLPLRYVNAVTNALLAFNSSVNFLIYFMVGRTFRRVFISSLRYPCVCVPIFVFLFLTLYFPQLAKRVFWRKDRFRRGAQRNFTTQSARSAVAPIVVMARSSAWRLPRTRPALP